ncbi:UNVERIFIED_CONTAM: hypothetical protein FKN15_038354 [Acipenser sinensis]
MPVFFPDAGDGSSPSKVQGLAGLHGGDSRGARTSAEEEPGFEVASEASAPPLSSSVLALMGRAATFLQVPWTPAAEPCQSFFPMQAMAPHPQKFKALPDFMEEVGKVKAKHLPSALVLTPSVLSALCASVIRCSWCFDAPCLGALGASAPQHVDIICFTPLVFSMQAETSSMAKFHACVSCKAKLPLENKHLLCVRCLGMQNASSAHGDETFQPSSCYTGSSSLPPPQSSAKRAKHSREAQDITDLKNQVAQILEYLAKQQAQAPAADPAFTSGSFHQEEEEGQVQEMTFEMDPSSEIISDVVLPHLKLDPSANGTGLQVPAGNLEGSARKVPIGVSYSATYSPPLALPSVPGLPRGSTIHLEPPGLGAKGTKTGNPTGFLRRREGTVLDGISTSGLNYCGPGMSPSSRGFTQRPCMP